MAIQIPFHSQASPGRSPDMGGTRQPAGHWPTQQAVYTQTPQDRTRATADMFSGGLQGLQSVADALGDAGKGFYEIAAKMRQMDDYVIRTDEQLAAAKLDAQMVEAQEKYQNDPEGLMQAYDSLNQQYRSTVLERDMPESLKLEMGHRVRLKTVNDRTNLVVNRLRDKKAQAYTRFGTALMSNVNNGNTEGARATVAEAVRNNVIDAATGERLSLVEGQKSEYNRFIADADAAAANLAGIRPTEIDLGDYEISSEQRHRAELYREQAQNRSQNRLLEQMIADPDNFTGEAVQDLVSRKYLDPSTAQRWVKSLSEAPLAPDAPEVQKVWRMVNSYQPAGDSETLERQNEIMIEMSMLSPRAKESVSLMQDALKKRVDGYEKTITNTLRRFEKGINALEGDDEGMDTERENMIYNRMADEIRDISKQFPNLTEEELYDKSRVKFELFRRKPVKEIQRATPKNEGGFIGMVKQFEGYNSNAYSDYKQTSIGYGTKARPGEKVITKAEADRRLKSELDSHRARVKDAAARYGYTFSQNEEDALTSFDYNTGSIEALLAKGTRSKTEIAARMLLYTKAGGKDLPGLIRRRKAEASMFRGD